MEFFIADKTHVGFRHIHPLLAELLRTLPMQVDPKALSETAEKRFFPEPTHAEEHEQMRSDWKAFVEPALHEHFRSARDVVSADLKGMTEKDDVFEILIPNKHVDAWLNVLNQARLALAADLGFDEDLLDKNGPDDIASDSGFAAFRVNLYGIMQQCLIDMTE